MTETTAPPHPAKYTDTILEVFRGVIEAEVALSGPLVVLDPFAGTGRVHLLASPAVVTRGVEIEPEWAAMHPDTVCGDSSDLAALGWELGSVGAICVSPCYGNRMSDHHEAKDASRRQGYRFALGRMPDRASAATLGWGDEYRTFHLACLREWRRVVRPGGLIVVNVSNHIRAGEECFVAEWFLANLLALGLKFEQAVPVPTPRMRFGQNHEARVDHEWVFVTRKRP